VNPFKLASLAMLSLVQVTIDLILQVCMALWSRLTLGVVGKVSMTSVGRLPIRGGLRPKAAFSIAPLAFLATWVSMFVSPALPSTRAVCMNG